MLTERPGLEIRFLWFQALKCDAHPWQKGNASMRERDRKKLKLRWGLLRTVVAALDSLARLAQVVCERSYEALAECP